MSTSTLLSSTSFPASPTPITTPTATNSASNAIEQEKTKQALAKMGLFLPRMPTLADILRKPINIYNWVVKDKKISLFRDQNDLFCRIIKIANAEILAEEDLNSAFPQELSLDDKITLLVNDYEPEIHDNHASFKLTPKLHELHRWTVDGMRVSLCQAGDRLVWDMFDDPSKTTCCFPADLNRDISLEDRAQYLQNVSQDMGTSILNHAKQQRRNPVNFDISHPFIELTPSGAACSCEFYYTNGPVRLFQKGEELIFALSGTQADSQHPSNNLIPIDFAQDLPKEELEAWLKDFEIKNVSMLSSQPFCLKKKTIQSQFNENIVIDRDHCAVTLLCYKMESSGMLGEKLGHSALAVEEIRNGKRWTRFADYGSTDGPRFREEYQSKPYMQSRTQLRTRIKAENLLSLIEKEIDEYEKNKTLIRYSLQGGNPERAPLYYSKKGVRGKWVLDNHHAWEENLIALQLTQTQKHNCLTWALHKLEIANIFDARSKERSAQCIHAIAAIPKYCTNVETSRDDAYITTAKDNALSVVSEETLALPLFLENPNKTLAELHPNKSFSKKEKRDLLKFLDFQFFFVPSNETFSTLVQLLHFYFGDLAHVKEAFLQSKNELSSAFQYWFDLFEDLLKLRDLVRENNLQAIKKMTAEQFQAFPSQEIDTILIQAMAGQKNAIAQDIVEKYYKYAPARVVANSLSTFSKSCLPLFQNLFRYKMKQKLLTQTEWALILSTQNPDLIEKELILAAETDLSLTVDMIMQWASSSKPGISDRSLLMTLEAALSKDRLSIAETIIHSPRFITVCDNVLKAAFEKMFSIKNEEMMCKIFESYSKRISFDEMTQLHQRAKRSGYTKLISAIDSKWFDKMGLDPFEKLAN